MSWLAISGIDLSAIAASAQDPKADRRDIGEAAEASDGSWRVTRQTRKHDQSFQSIPLSPSDAYAWESLITGEGHHWGFDSLLKLYSGKGLAPTAGFVATQVAGTPKFGDGVLRLTATTGTITWPAAVNSSGGTGAWTVMLWRYESSVWHHYVVTSSGHKWVDGVRNDAATTTFLSVSGANVTLTNTAGAAQDYDDLVVLPFVVLDTWPPLIFAAASVAYSELPYLTCSGSCVEEAPTRKMAGTCNVSGIKQANTGAGMSNAVKVLQVELKAA